MPATSPSFTQSGPIRLVITGASGFVGRHLVECSLRDPAIEQVIACDLRSAGVDATGSQHRGRLSQQLLDVRNADACVHLLRAVRPTHILHAAAITSGAERELVEVNVQGTRNMLAAVATLNSVERFLLLSSSAVYGTPSNDIPCDEHHPLDLRGVYAQSKRRAEELLLKQARISASSFAVARIGPCYGPGETPGRYRPSVSLVAQLLSALRAGSPLRVTGEDYTRDWTHLDDIYAALSSLLFAPVLHNDIYNVSAGISISARELLRCFEERGLPVEWTTAAYADLHLRPEDARKPLVIDRLRQDTTFTPTTTWRERIATLIAQSISVENPFTTK